MARQDYIAAKKLGDAYIRFCMKNGLSAYSPVLDSFEEIKESAREAKCTDESTSIWDFWSFP